MPSRAMARAAAAMIVANGGGVQNSCLGAVKGRDAEGSTREDQRAVGAIPTPDDSYTPGPWHAAQSSEGSAFTVFDDNNGSLASVWPETLLGKAYPLKANALLISAAPELHASLDETHRWVRRIQDVLTGYLVPDGYDADEAVNRLIEMLDGPEQREIQGRAFAALAKVRAEQVPA